MDDRVSFVTNGPHTAHVQQARLRVSVGTDRRWYKLHTPTNQGSSRAARARAGVATQGSTNRPARPLNYLSIRHHADGRAEHLVAQVLVLLADRAGHPVCTIAVGVDPGLRCGLRIRMPES